MSCPQGTSRSGFTIASYKLLLIGTAEIVSGKNNTLTPGKLTPGLLSNRAFRVN